MSKHPAGVSSGFHGWKILGLSTFSQFVAVGFTVYLIGIYIGPLAKAYSATRGQLGWSATIFYVASAVMGPLLGYWVDRGKVRIILTSGGIMLAAGFLLLSQSVNLLQAALVSILLLAPGAAMLGVVPSTAMIVQWFERRRGFAIGVSAAGMSLGGFLMPPLVAWLISSFEWRFSLVLLAVAIVMLLVPAAWLLAVSRPSDMGQYPDGADEPPWRDITPGEVPGPTARLGKIVSQRNFWMISLSVGLLSFGSVLMITYLVPFARERGIDLQMSASMLSVFAGCAMVGKFAAGWLCDRFHCANVMTAIITTATFGWLPMLFMSGITAFSVSAGIVGFAVGSLVPVWASLIARNFGPEVYGRVQGAMSLAVVVFIMIPGPLGGYLSDVYGTYATGFSMLWWAFPVAIVCSLLISRGGDVTSTKQAPSRP